MAIKDVKQYYYTMMCQYLEMKEDLADYEKAVRDGNITEDQLAVVKEEVNEIEKNYNRLTYIMFLLEQPNRSNKKNKYIEVNKNLLKLFKQKAADQESVVDENDSVLNQIRDELKQLTNKGSN